MRDQSLGKGFWHALAEKDHCGSAKGFCACRHAEPVISSTGGDIGFGALRFALDDGAMGDDIGCTKCFETAQAHAGALIFHAELRDIQILRNIGSLQHFSFSSIGATGQKGLHSGRISRGGGDVAQDVDSQTNVAVGVLQYIHPVNGAHRNRKSKPICDLSQRGIVNFTACL